MLLPIIPIRTFFGSKRAENGHEKAPVTGLNLGGYFRVGLAVD